MDDSLTVSILAGAMLVLALLHVRLMLRVWRLEDRIKEPR